MLSKLGSGFKLNLFSLTIHSFTITTPIPPPQQAVFFLCSFNPAPARYLLTIIMKLTPRTKPFSSNFADLSFHKLSHFSKTKQILLWEILSTRFKPLYFQRACPFTLTRSAVSSPLTCASSPLSYISLFHLQDSHLSTDTHYPVNF